MGYNRSGKARKDRLKRRKKHLNQLERKAARQQKASPAPAKEA